MKATENARCEYGRYVEEKAKLLPFFNKPEYRKYSNLHLCVNPLEHPIFKRLFFPQWRVSLRKRLLHFLKLLKPVSNMYIYK